MHERPHREHGDVRPHLAADAHDVEHLRKALLTARTRSRVRVGRLARSSKGRFTAAELRAFERGDLPIDPTTMSTLAVLYGCDLRAALPSRRPITIEHDRITACGLAAEYDPTDHTTVLPAFERLVRMLRHAGPDDEIDLRRPDLQVVVTYWAQCMMEQVHTRVMRTVQHSA